MRRVLAVMCMLCAPIVARASDYGCTVLLCLADPRGPTTEAECRPPIHRLFRDLAKGRPFPSCSMAQGPNGRSYARQGYGYYDPCPQGTSPLEEGRRALQDKGPGARINPQQAHLSFGLYPSEEYGVPNLVCVGRIVGHTSFMDSSDNIYMVDIYDRVVLMPPASSPRFIDVFIDDALYRRVRW